MPESWSTFWDGVWNGLQGGWATNAQVTDRENAAVRAYGVDPSTGKLIAPQYAVAASLAGYDPTNPGAFVTSTKAQADEFYNTQYQQDWNDLSSQFGFDLPGVPSGSTSGLLVVALVLIVGFFLIKAVK